MIIETRDSRVEQIVAELADPTLAETTHVVDRLQQVEELVRLDAIRTYEPLLPLCLSLHGKPYSLKNYYPFSPMFNLVQPVKVALIAGRQTSKSQTMATTSVMRVGSMPNYRILHVTPLFEQIRRFSSNYVKPLIDNSPIRPLWVDKNTNSSVLQRSLINQSTMFFSFASTSSDRIRGLAVHQVVYDESIPQFSLVNTPTGSTMIKDIAPGDLVYGADRNGKVTVERVIANSCHGVRACFNIHLADGSTYAGTTDSFVGTTAGWKRVSSVIEELDAVTSTNATRHDAGGRLLKCDDKKSEVHLSARLDSARVQRSEVPNITRVRTYAAQEAEESRLRGMVERMGDRIPAGTAVYRILVSPRRLEAGDQGLAKPAHLGRRRLLVHGRRWLLSAFQVRRVSHRRVYTPRSGVASYLADATWYASHMLSNQKSKTASREVLHNPAQRGQYASVDGEDQAVHAAVHDVQVGTTRAGNRVAVRLLRPALPGSKQLWQKVRKRLRCQATKALLRGVVVLEGLHQAMSGRAASRSSIHNQTQSTSQISLLGQPGAQSSIKKGVRQSLREETSGPRRAVQGETNSQRSGGTCLEGVAMPAVLDHRTTRRSRWQSDLLSRLPKNSYSRDKSETCCDVDRGTQSRRRTTPTTRNIYMSTLPQARAHWTPLEASYSVRGLPTARRCGEKATEICGQKVGSSDIVGVSWAGYHVVMDLEVDNCRNFFAGNTLTHNCQDLDPDLPSVANECMSAAQTYKASSIYGGTPKTLDNLMESIWRDSSQAEWVMQCQHCNYYNIPALEFDLDKMVGPYHDDISEEVPAVVCAKCRKPLRPRMGEWVHREPSRRWGFSGFHIPQIILPLHYADPSKWATLLAKQNGAGNMTRARFLNEVMGVSVDAGQKLVSETELRRASDLPWKRTARPNHDLMVQSDDYHMKVLAVDWGGGGDQGVSFTVVAILGYLPSGEIHVIWAKRMVQSTNHVEEANEIKFLFNAFRCHYIAHDYTGAGAIRETVLVGSGVPAERILPIEYIGAAAGSIIRFIPASLTHGRDRYRLDKTRSLLTLCSAIRYRLVRFFEYDYYSADEKGLISDFLALIENKTPSRTGSDIYTIVRNPNLTDDFAQAVNIGCAAIWHSNNAWPDFASHYQQQSMSAEQMAEIGDPDSNDWSGTGTPQVG